VELRDDETSNPKTQHFCKNLAEKRHLPFADETWLLIPHASGGYTGLN